MRLFWFFGRSLDLEVSYKANHLMLAEKNDPSNNCAEPQLEETSVVQDPEREEFVSSQHGRGYTGYVKPFFDGFLNWKGYLKAYNHLVLAEKDDSSAKYDCVKPQLKETSVVQDPEREEFVSSQHGRGYTSYVKPPFSKLLCVMLLMMNFTAVYSMKARVVHPPQSVNTTLATNSVQMSCKVEAEIIRFLVDNENADQDSVRDKGIFVQSDGFNSLALTMTVNEALNNTMVECVAVNVVDDPSSSTSDPAYLVIEGMLPQPSNLSVSLNNQSMQSSELLVTWSASQTRFNTSVTGYNISSSLLKNEGPSFTTKTQIPYQITDIDPCKEINITVTPFNGQEGNPAEVNGIYLPSPSSNISTELFVNASELEDSNRVQFLFVINITHLCPGSVPTHIKVVIQRFNDKLFVDEYQSELMDSEEDDKLISIEEIELDQSIEYTAIIEFNNGFGLAGSNQLFNFMVNSTMNTIANSSGSGGLNSTEPTNPVSTSESPTSFVILGTIIAVCSVMITTLLLIIVVMVSLIYCKVCNRNSGQKNCNTPSGTPL